MAFITPIAFDLIRIFIHFCCVRFLLGAEVGRGGVGAAGDGVGKGLWKAEIRNSVEIPVEIPVEILLKRRRHI